MVSEIIINEDLEEKINYPIDVGRMSFYIHH